MLNFNQIKELIKEIDSSSLRVFELENSDIRLKLSKNEDNYLYKENDCTPIFRRYLLEKEVLEKAIKIIKKKLYKLSAGILEDIRLPDTKEE